MEILLSRAGIALLTFVAGLLAVGLWYGYRQRAAREPQPLIVSTDFDVPPPTPDAASEAAILIEATWRRSKYLHAVEIVQHDKERYLRPMKFENTAEVTWDVDLDLGDDIENQLIVLRPTPATGREFKVEQQFETTFQVSGEGPHIDLMDWKHYRSPWRELKRMGDDAFLIPVISEADARRFPAVTKRERYRAVLRASDKDWANKARRCRTLTTEPCSVGVSRISLRVKVKEEGRWKLINRFNFMIAMGC